MINLIIYLEKNQPAIELVHELLRERFIANASIDWENSAYKIENDQVIKHVNTVITCQTKSMLFPQIEKLIKSKLGEEIPIYSLPIIQSNNSFDQMIRKQTLNTTNESV